MKLKYLCCSCLQFLLFLCLLILPLTITFKLFIVNTNSCFYTSNNIELATEKLFNLIDIDKNTFNSSDLYKLNRELSIEQMQFFWSNEGCSYNVEKITEFLKNNESIIIENRGVGLTEENYKTLSDLNERYKQLDNDEKQHLDNNIFAKQFRTLSRKKSIYVISVITVLLTLLIALVLKDNIGKSLIFYCIATISSGIVGLLNYGIYIGYHNMTGKAINSINSGLFGFAKNINIIFLLLGIMIMILRVIYKKKYII